MQSAASRPNRLLPQPSGFEGRIPVGVLLHVDDLAVAKREHPELLRFGDFDPTPSASSTPTNRYHDLIPPVDELQGSVPGFVAGFSERRKQSTFPGNRCNSPHQGSPDAPPRRWCDRETRIWPPGPLLFDPGDEKPRGPVGRSRRSPPTSPTQYLGRVPLSMQRGTFKSCV
jgi:hypothetical protein